MDELLTSDLSNFLTEVNNANHVVIEPHEGNYKSKIIRFNDKHSMFELRSEYYENNERNYGGHEVISYFLRINEFIPLIKSLKTNNSASFKLECVTCVDRGSWDKEFIYNEASYRVEVQSGILECEMKLKNLELDYIVKFTPTGKLLSNFSDFEKCLSQDVIDYLIDSVINEARIKK